MTPSMTLRAIRPRLSSALLVTGICLFSISTPCAGQSDVEHERQLSEQLDRKMREFAEKMQVPAIELGVIKDGRIVFSGAYGVRRQKTNEPITAHSLFHMASISKAFVATALVQLAERGRLSLDDRIVDLLPYFRLADERYRDITIRQVLTHTSGIPDVRDYQWDRPQYDDGAAERYVRSLSALKLRFQPGERFLYSNIGFDVLGDVIAKASGVSFEDYVEANILRPLGMTESTFLKTRVPEGLSVSPHLRNLSTLFAVRPAQVYPYNRAHAPSSTLHSNVGDMLRWCQTNMNGGELEGQRILSPQSQELLWTRQADQGLRDPAKAELMGGVGLGWFLGTYRGLRMISYGGADPGFRAFVILIPERGTAAVAMGNSDSMRAGRLARAALDLALE